MELCDKPDCLELATQTCNCKGPEEETILCKHHMPEHTKEIGSHNIRLIEATDRKDQIIARLKELIKETHGKIEHVTQTCKDKIELIEQEMIESIEVLDRFIRKCYSIIVALKAKPESEHLIRNPLSAIRYLPEETLTHYLAGLSGPKIELEQGSITDSCIQFSLSNLNCINIDIIDPEKELNYHDQESNTERIPHIQQMNLPAHFQALCLQHDLVLLAGGKEQDNQSSKKCFILNFRKKTFKRIKTLSVGVHSHTMGWLKNTPIIVGGISDQELGTSKVQLLGKKWRVFADLNQARYDCSVANSEKKTYVFGGKCADSGINSIEVYDFKSKSWKRIECDLPKMDIWKAATLVTDSKKLIIFGGNTPHLEGSRDIWVCDLKGRDKCQKAAEEIPEQYTCLYNMWVVTEDGIKTWTNGKEVSGKNITYSLKSSSS